MGGRLHYKAQVEKILVEDDCAVGVRLYDDTEVRADYVISAADGYEHGERHVWQSDRSGNKLLSAVRALEMVGEYLEQA